MKQSSQGENIDITWPASTNYTQNGNFPLDITYALGTYIVQSALTGYIYFVFDVTGAEYRATCSDLEILPLFRRCRTWPVTSQWLVPDWQDVYIPFAWR